jgi:hypothetical protein
MHLCFVPGHSKVLIRKCLYLVDFFGAEAGEAVIVAGLRFLFSSRGPLTDFFTAGVEPEFTRWLFDTGVGRAFEFGV